MFFLITESFVRLAEGSGVDKEKAHKALEYLDLSARLGKHFVCAETGTLFDRIIRLKLDTPCFREIRNNFTFYANTGRTYQWHAEFLPSSTKSLLDEKKKTIFISLDEINRFEIYRETQVLGENLSDVSFFRIVLDYYKKIHAYEKTYNSFHPLLGGGRTTADVFGFECSESMAFLLCISDSDFKYSGASLGDTAKAIKDVLDGKKHNCFNGHYYHLQEAREVENLIPLTLYKMYADNPQAGAKKKYNEIAKFFAIDSKIAPYFDIKEGVNLHALKNRKKDDPVLENMRKMIPEIEKRMANDLKEIEQKYPGIKGDAKKEVMRKYHYIDGLGGRILENILRGDFVDPSKFIPEMEGGAYPFQTNEYERIGRLLYDWTASSKKMRL